MRVLAAIGFCWESVRGLFSGVGVGEREGTVRVGVGEGEGTVRVGVGRGLGGRLFCWDRMVGRQERRGEDSPALLCYL